MENRITSSRMVCGNKVYVYHGEHPGMFPVVYEDTSLILYRGYRIRLDWSGTGPAYITYSNRVGTYELEFDNVDKALDFIDGINTVKRYAVFRRPGKLSWVDHNRPIPPTPEVNAYGWLPEGFWLPAFIVSDEYIRIGHLIAIRLTASYIEDTGFDPYPYSSSSIWLCSDGYTTYRGYEAEKHIAEKASAKRRELKVVAETTDENGRKQLRVQACQYISAAGKLIRPGQISGWVSESSLSTVKRSWVEYSSSAINSSLDNCYIGKRSVIINSRLENLVVDNSYLVDTLILHSTANSSECSRDANGHINGLDLR